MKRNNIKLHSVAAIAVAALASACSSDAVTDALENNPGKAETVTLVASQPGNDTRVGFTEGGKGYWQAGDAIGVWSKGDNKFSSFAITSSAGEATATFSGTVVNGVGDYAVYPYNEKHGLQGNVLTYYLPEKYTYTSVDQTFFPEGKDGNSFGMPMLGTISEGYAVTFSHLAGVVCLQIDKMPAESGTVKVTASGMQLCGTFTASLADMENTAPEIKTAASEADNAVTFLYSGATADKPGIFYLPVATGNYTLTVVVAGNKKTSTTIHSVEMVRERLQQLDVTTKYVTASSSSEGKIINGHKFIDLGLPSGLLWAETNIGAETAYDDGNYYAWGETAPKSTYTQSNCNYFITDSTYSEIYEKYLYTYKYSYDNGKTELDLEDDAAYVNWGSGCRMPTLSEFAELDNTDNCTWTLVSCTNSAGETINCYKVVSVKNGNIIYLPASGHRAIDDLYYRGSEGYYWSSSLLIHDGVSCAYPLYFAGVYHNAGGPRGYRYFGVPVRPVAEPQK